MSNNKLKLLSILEAIEKIETYTASFEDGEDFYYDAKSFDASMMQFVVIGEMIDKLDNNFKLSNPHIEWIKIKNFRNIIAHDYFGIDSDEIWDIIQNKIKPLKNEIAKLISNLDENNKKDK
jgi:uncharacterized protein with HEPN domain